MTVNKNAVPERSAPSGRDQRASDRHAGGDHPRGSRSPRREQLSNWIAEVLDHMGDESVVERVRDQVVALCRRFPVYG